MPLLSEILTIIFLLVGLFFMLVGAIGAVRLPDTLNRLHAATKCSTLGLSGLLLATILHLGDFVVLTKAILTLLFIFASNPVGAHVLAKAALHTKAPSWEGQIDDEHATDIARRDRQGADKQGDGDMLDASTGAGS